MLFKERQNLLPIDGLVRHGRQRLILQGRGRLDRVNGGLDRHASQQHQDEEQWSSKFHRAALWQKVLIVKQ